MIDNIIKTISEIIDQIIDLFNCIISIGTCSSCCNEHDCHSESE